MNINLHDVIYGRVSINDYDLINYIFSHNNEGKTVIVTPNIELWEDYILQFIPDKNIVFSDGDVSRIRGVRANNIFILSDCDLTTEEVNDIVSGFIETSDNSPYWNRVKVRSQIIWNVS